MTRPSASRRSAIDAFIVMDVLAEANRREAAGEPIVHLEVGQPATSAPRSAREAAKAAIDSGKLGYTEALGTPDLRARIARHYGERYGLDLDPGRVVVTAGSSAGFVLAFLALFDQNARVALPAPGYPCYRQILGALGCRPVLVPTGEADRWMPSSEALAEIHREERLAGLLVASPANPTGAMLEPERLRQLTGACREQGIAFVSDEIYHGLTWTLPETTALSFDRDAIVVNSFSKYFSMTGWRIGWLVVPEYLVRPIERLAQNLYISPTTISQIAALAAFDGRDELEAIKAGYARNRQTLLEGLPRLGFDRLAPADGAFYLYVDIAHTGLDSLTLSRRLLAEVGLATTPGLDFDPGRGADHVRLSYAGSHADMLEALERLARFRAA